MKDNSWKELIKPALTALVIIVLVTLLLTSVCKCGTLTTYRFVAPGLGGMVSNYDDEMLQSTDALYLLNGYVTETPGVIERRTAIKDYGANVTSIYGASGYFNTWTGDKLILGVTDHGVYEYKVVKCTITVVANNTAYDDTINADASPSTYTSDGSATEAEITAGLVAAINADADVNGSVTAYDSTTFYIVQGDAAGVAFTIAVDTIQDTTTTQVCTTSYSLGMFVVSDTFGTEVGYDTLDGTIFPTADAYHDWTPYEDMLIHADGKSIPSIFTITQGFKFVDSLPDTLGSQPRFISMGLEAPGQPRVNVLESSGGLSGIYVYAFAYKSNGDHGDLGIQSAPVYTDEKAVAITLFPHFESVVQIYRKRLDGKQSWYFLDTVYHADDSHVVYIDTVSDTLSAGLGTVDTSIATPGQLRRHPVGAVSQPRIWADTGSSPAFPPDLDTVTYCLWPESTYRFAYSFYDPITGLESPFGPAFIDTVIDTVTREVVGDDTAIVCGTVFDFGYVDTTSRPKWIRVYQTITQTNQVGGGDTTIWYGLFEMRSQDRYINVGQWDDTNVVVGLDTNYILPEFDTVYKYELLRNDLGGVKIQPPYSYDCRIPFSDIEYMAGQFWGIGDPDYPNRIYFSEYDWPGMNIFNWYPLDFVRIQEIGNDELIKIERAEGFGADALYVFAHNSIWLLNTSGDYQAISTRVGVASMETVVKHGENVYFLSPDLRIHVLTGGQIQEISQPVENYVESVFVDWNIYGYQGFYAWAHTFGDYVRWFNDTTGMGLSFNTISQVWTLERYGSGAYVPRGSISYDTMRSVGASVIMTSDVELLYMDSTVSLRKADPTAYYDASGVSLEKAIPFIYQTPRLGDGTRYQQIQRFDVTLDYSHLGALHYTIYNEDNDSLCGDSIYLSGDAPVHLRIHPPYNNCLRPSLKIYSNDTDSLWTGGGDPFWRFYYHDFKVMDLNVKVRDMGVGSVQ